MEHVDHLLGNGDSSNLIGEFPTADIIATNKAPGRNVQVKRYDFRRPDKFSKEQLRTLTIIGNNFCRLLTVQISSFLRRNAAFRISMVDQLDFSEFLYPLHDEAAFAVINLRPPQDPIILHSDLSLAKAFTDFACMAASEMLEDGELKDISWAVTELLFLQMTESLKVAWKPIEQTAPILANVESKKAYVQVLAPTEMIVQVSIDAEIEGIQGKINLVLPFLTLEKIIPKLRTESAYGKKESFPASNLSWIMKLKMDSTIYTDCESMSLQKLSELKTGSLIPLPALDRGEAWLEFGKERFLELQMLNPKALQAGWLIKSKVDIPATEIHQKNASELDPTVHRMEQQLLELSNRVQKIADHAFFGPEAEPETTEDRHKPLHFLNHVSPERILNVIQGERRQLIALILSNLPAGIAAQLLEALADTQKPDIIKRICMIGIQNPEVIAAITMALHRKLGFIKELSPTESNGIEHAAMILSATAAHTESFVFEQLEQTQAELAAQLRSVMPS